MYLNSYLFVFFLAVGLSTALQCYSCAGDEAACPKNPTEAQIAKFNKQNCTGDLAHACAKYSIDLLNGDSITYRSCEPPYIGGIKKDGPDFCSFVSSMYTPLVDGGLLIGTSCKTCDSVNCNT